MDQSTIKRVLSLVSCYTPPYLDRENICMEILFESWQHRIEVPSIDFIKNRCFNAMRSMKLNQRSILNKIKEQHKQQSEQQMSQDKDELNKLTKVLSGDEKKIVWYRYYQDMSLREISDTLKLPILTISETLQAALYKMREAA